MRVRPYDRVRAGRYHLLRQCALVIAVVFIVLKAPVNAGHNEIAVCVRRPDLLEKARRIIAGEDTRLRIRRRLSVDRRLILFRLRRRHIGDRPAVDPRIVRSGRLLKVPAGAHLRNARLRERIQRVRQRVGAVVEDMVVRQKDKVDAQLLQIFHTRRIGAEMIGLRHLAAPGAVGELVVQHEQIEPAHRVDAVRREAVQYTVRLRVHLLCRRPPFREVDVAGKAERDCLRVVRRFLRGGGNRRYLRSLRNGRSRRGNRCGSRCSRFRGRYGGFRRGSRRHGRRDRPRGRHSRFCGRHGRFRRRRNRFRGRCRWHRTHGQRR